MHDQANIRATEVVVGAHRRGEGVWKVLASSGRVHHDATSGRGGSGGQVDVQAGVAEGPSRLGDRE